MQIAVVLGAGGASAWAFHAGVAAAVQTALGIDFTTTELVLGTSAGATVAASLKAGAAPADIADMVTTPPPPEQRKQVEAERERQPRRLQPLAPRWLRHALPGGRGLGMAVAGVLPPGRYPTWGLARFPGVQQLRAWPAGLWIPAVRVSDGKVVVFGRDRQDVDVATALQASSAVPAMFQPVAIGDERFVDGAVDSPTHLDLVPPERFDLVVVSSPMSRRRPRPLRIVARRRLDEELGWARAAALDVAVIEPDPATVEAFTDFPRQSRDAGHAIVALAERQALEMLGDLA